MTQNPPRILLVNDDGIDAPGLVLLEKIVRGISDDIWVVAPDEEKSGAGHSLSTYHPMRVQAARRAALRGKGHADRLRAARRLRTDPGSPAPTSSSPASIAARTWPRTSPIRAPPRRRWKGRCWAFRPSRSARCSARPRRVHWATAEAWAGRVIEKLLGLAWRPGSFINVNFPDCPPEDSARHPRHHPGPAPARHLPPDPPGR